MNGKFERAERTKSPEWLSVFTLQLIGAVLIALALRRIFFLSGPGGRGTEDLLYCAGCCHVCSGLRDVLSVLTAKPAVIRPAPVFSMPGSTPEEFCGMRW